MSTLAAHSLMLQHHKPLLQHQKPLLMVPYFVQSGMAVVSQHVMQDIIELAEPLLEPSRVAHGRRPSSNICHQMRRTCWLGPRRCRVLVLAKCRVIISSAHQQLMLPDRAIGERASALLFCPKPA